MKLVEKGSKMHGRLPRYLAPATLEMGSRTVKLVQHCMHLVRDERSLDYIRAEIQRMNIELCPKGQQPIEPEVLEIEVLSCIPRFIAARSS